VFAHIWFIKAENLIHFLKDVQQPIQLIQFQLIIIKQVRPTDKMIKYNKNKYSRKNYLSLAIPDIKEKTIAVRK
jgi:hypothetical protein